MVHFHEKMLLSSGVSLMSPVSSLASAAIFTSAYANTSKARKLTSFFILVTAVCCQRRGSQTCEWAYAFASSRRHGSICAASPVRVRMRYRLGGYEAARREEVSRRKMQNTVSSDWTDNSSLSVSEQPMSESSVIADARHVARVRVSPISRGCELGKSEWE